MPEPGQLVIPVDLACAAEREGREDWLAALPETIGGLETVWSIHVGEPFQPGGQTAWVAPATRGGEDLVVKVLWRHPEAEHEAEGLRVWDGDGAVRLHATAEVGSETVALLLERCWPGTTLKGRPELEQATLSPGCCAACGDARLPLTGSTRSSRCASFGPLSSSTELPTTADAWILAWNDRGLRCSGSCLPLPSMRCCSALIFMPATCSPPSGSHGWPSTRSPMSATQPTTPSNMCSTATSVCAPIPMACCDAWLSC